MDERMREAVLNRVYQERLENSMRVMATFHIPREVVVRAPEVIVPFEGRRYLTDWRVTDDGKIKHWSEGYAPNMVPIYCQEVWEDWGDDGHVDFALRGFMYVVEDSPQFKDPLGSYPTLEEN